MDQMIQSLIDNPEDNLHVFPEADHLTDFGARIKSKLYERAKALKASPALIEILAKLLKNDTYVDLAPFRCFAVNDLSDLISKMRSDSEMVALNLSTLPSITSEGVKTILPPNPTISSLYLIADVHTYLEHVKSNNASDTKILAQVQTLKEWWEANYQPSEILGFYAEPDIQEIVRRVYTKADE